MRANFEAQMVPIRIRQRLPEPKPYMQEQHALIFCFVQYYIFVKGYSGGYDGRL